MSQLELKRIEIFKKLSEKRLKQSQAAEILSLSTRQIKRLFKAYQQIGMDALISKRRGKPGNHQFPPVFKQHAMDLICQHYRDYGPTLATEKLFELHSIKIGVETVRQLMITAGLWKTRSQRLKRAYQPRYRKLELGPLRQYADLGVLHEAIALTIHYYNSKRIHTALNMCPDEYAKHLDQLEIICT